MGSFVRFLSSSANSKKHFDVVVSGGGMIGTALTCLLGKLSLNNTTFLCTLVLLYSNSQCDTDILPNIVDIGLIYYS